MESSDVDESSNTEASVWCWNLEDLARTKAEWTGLPIRQTGESFFISLCLFSVKLSSMAPCYMNTWSTTTNSAYALFEKCLLIAGLPACLVDPRHCSSVQDSNFLIQL